jgi:hypothetical protein
MTLLLSACMVGDLAGGGGGGGGGGDNDFKRDAFASLEFSPAAVQALLDQADQYVLSLEEGAVGAVQAGLCTLGNGNTPFASSILQSIDGVSVKGAFNLASLLTGGKSPVGFKAGVEVVYWFPPGSDTIERHVFIIPQFDVSSAASVGELEAGVIFGCNGDVNNYSGYFGSVGVAGANLNLGMDFGPLFSKYFQNSLPSNVPGANDNQPIDLGGVKQVLKSAGGRLRTAAAQRRANPYLVSEIEGVLKEVRYQFRLNDGYWNTELNFLFRRGVLVANGQYRNGATSVAEQLLDEAASYSPSVGESAQDYSLRLPGVLPRYGEVMDEFWGRDDNSTIRAPDGLDQELFSVSGHTGTSQKTVYQVAFNTEIYGSDGPGLYSVYGDTLTELQNIMLYDDTYGCSRQRERYPAGRWFRTYIGDSELVFDCMGFGPGELFEPGVTGRTYYESYFTSDMAPELARIKSFFDDFETFRYGVHQGMLIVHDAFHTQKSALSLSVGGIQGSSAADALTGCNSISLSPQGFSNVATIGFAALRSAANLLRGQLSTGILSSLSSVRANASVSAGLSYYYPVPYFAGSYPVEEGWPLVRGVRLLKNISCQ